MKSRNTIILLALCLGIFAYIKLVHKKIQTVEEREKRQGKPVQIERDKIDAITLRNAEGTIEFKKRDGNWYIDAPVKDRAETMNVTALLTSAEGIKWSPVTDVKDVKESLKEFGLAKGDVSLKFTGQKGIDQFNLDRDSVELLMGKDGAVEGRVYYRVEGSDNAYVGPKDLRDQASKGIKDWRNRTLSDVTASQVTKLTLKTAKGDIELEKQGANWSFTKPFKARGDNQKITDLISNATTPRVEEFVSESKDLGVYGLNEPRATLTMVAEGQKDPVVLQIGAAKQEKKEEKKDEKKDEKKPGEPPAPPTPPAHVYVKLSTREGVVTVPAAIESLINTQPNDLRDQSLMRVQPDIVDRITIESPKGKIVLGRSGEQWVKKVEGKADEPVNNAAAAKLLNDLVNAKVSRFVADLASDLKGFGLDQPSTTVTLSSYSTEGTPETKPGEKPIVKLLLGRFEGDAGYAKLDDEPFIVAVPASLQNDIWSDPIQWQDLKINDLKKDDIVALEVVRSGQPATSLVKDKDKGWKLAQGEEKLNQTNVQSLLNTIATLRAVRWIGATDPAAYGMDKPSLVVSYTLADKKTGKLTIGKLSPEQMWLTTIDGRTGTFVITQGDFDALNATLVEGQKAAVTPPTVPGAGTPAPVTPAPVSPAPGAAKPGPITVTTPPVTVPPPPSATDAPVPAPVPAPQPTPAPADATKPQEAPKPTEVPGGTAKPAPESAPKP